MKKIVVLAVMCFFSIIEVQAINFAIKRGDDVIIKEFVAQKVYGKDAYFFSPYDEYEIKDIWRLNNLASFGGVIYNREDLFDAVIQKMIWQTVHPECQIDLVENNKIIDDKRFIASIEEALSNYSRPHSLDKTSYNINYGEILTLESAETFYSYAPNNASANITDYKIDLAIQNLGEKEINFSNTINRYGNLFYATSISYQPFSIKVNVIGNKGVIKVLGKYAYNYRFAVYDTLGNFIQNININEMNNTFYFAKKDIILKDLDGNLEDIIIKNEDKDLYDIVIDLTDKYYDVNISTYLKDISYNIEDELVTSDITIKDERGATVASCKEKRCNLQLKFGRYEIIDNVTNRKEIWEIDNDIEIDLKQYWLTGIITDVKIDKIKKLDQEYSVELIDNYVYLLKNYLKPDIYEVTSNDKTYELDLRNSDKYIYMDGNGVYYLWIKDNNNVTENKEDEIKNEQEENKKDDSYQKPLESEIDNTKKDNELNNEVEVVEITEEIEVSVPNTEIRCFYGDYCDIKKKYILNYFDSLN